MADMINAFQSMTREDANKTVSKLSICAGLMFSIALILLLLLGAGSVWSNKQIVVGAIVILCTIATVASLCATMTVIGYSLRASVIELTEEIRRRSQMDNDAEKS